MENRRPRLLRVFALSALPLAAASVVACTSSSTSTPPTVDAGLDATPDVAVPNDSAPPVDAGGTVPADPGPDDQGTTSAAETWTAAASPHRLTADVQVRAKLTIEPCAVVLLGGGYGIDVGSNTDKGSIVAHGTSQKINGVLDVRPVTFDAVDPAAKWSQITVEALGTVDFAVVAIKSGGAVTTGERG